MNVLVFKVKNENFLPFQQFNEVAAQKPVQNFQFFSVHSIRFFQYFRCFPDKRKNSRNRRQNFIYLNSKCQIPILKQRSSEDYIKINEKITNSSFFTGQPRYNARPGQSRYVAHKHHIFWAETRTCCYCLLGFTGSRYFLMYPVFN